MLVYKTSVWTKIKMMIILACLLFFILPFYLAHGVFVAWFGYTVPQKALAYAIKLIFAYTQNERQ